MSDEEALQKYRSLSISFIEKNRVELIRIYLQHSKGTGENEGEGILVINFNEIEAKQNVDVSFIAMKLLPPDILEIINERKTVNNENIVYFLLSTPFEEKILEFDIRTLV